MEELITIEELTKFLKVSSRTIFNYMQQKKLKGFKIGKEWRFEKTEIEKFINQQKNK